MMEELKKDSTMNIRKTKFILWSAQTDLGMSSFKESGFDMFCKNRTFLKLLIVEKPFSS